MDILFHFHFESASFWLLEKVQSWESPCEKEHSSGRREQVLEVWSHPFSFWFFLATSGTFGELWGRKSFASLESPSSSQPEPESQALTCPVVFPRDAAGSDNCRTGLGVSSQILVSAPRNTQGPACPSQHPSCAARPDHHGIFMELHRGQGWKGP